MKYWFLVLAFMVVAFFVGLFCGATGTYLTSPQAAKAARTVCLATKQQPAMAAFVDPKTGELFAVPTLQEVCTDVKN